MENKKEELLAMRKQKSFLFMIFAIATILIWCNVDLVSAAEKVTLNTTTSILVKGEAITLKMTGTSKKVTWSTTNKKVVTVSSEGRVTPVGYGTAYVKATVDGKTYKCFVRVVDPSKIYLSPSSTKVTVDGKAVCLNPKSNTYSNAAIKAMKLTYKVSGNSGVKVSSSGKVTATKAGSFKVTAYVHGKAIKTVSMKAVNGFPGFNETEVNVDVGDTIEVRFANNFLADLDYVDITSSNPKVAVAQEAFTTKDLDHYYGIEIEGLKDGTATISVKVSGVTKSIKVIVGQGVTILAPVDAVKTGNFTGYSGNPLTTLKWVRQFIDDNNLDSDALTDREKITIIQNYLINNANKNTGDTIYKSYISRVLFNGYYAGADCNAYATTFAFLCESIGIEVYYCGGAANNGSVYAGHAWNKVKADGTWYYIDSYWNACLQNFDYFLSTTLWSSHVLDEEGYYGDIYYDNETTYASELY